MAEIKQIEKLTLIPMRIRIFLFMFIVASMLIGVTALNYYIIIEEEKLFSAVNMSGRQRMLSQRITFFANSLKDIKSKEITPVSQQNETYILNNFRAANTLFKESHEILVNGSEDHNIPKPTTRLQKHYFEGNDNLDNMVKIFLDNANNVNDLTTKEIITPQDRLSITSSLKTLNNMAGDSLLKKLDEAVNIYEEEGRSGIAQLQIINLIILILSFPTLLFLWLAIFRPMEFQTKKYIKDLSKQKNIFEEEKGRLELALRGASIGIWDWDIETKKFYWSSVSINLLGLQDIDNLETDVSLFETMLHPDDKEFFDSELMDHFKLGKKFEVDVRLKHNKGYWLWTRICGQALWSQNHRAYRMLGSVEDITKLKEISLQTANFIQGIEAANISFAIIDLNDKQRQFSYISPAFCNLVGGEKEIILKGNLSIFTGPETSMNSLDQIDYALNSSKELQLKIFSYKLDGTPFWNEIILRPIIDEKTKKAESYIVIFNDLTESMTREKQEVRRQRTESLGTLAGSVAHEINNLLMPMTMAKDILEDALKEDCDPFAREQLDIMVDYANQAKEIVQGILTFSRKETKDLQKVNLYEELGSAVHFIKNLLSNRTTLTLLPLQNDNNKNLRAFINSTEMKQIITNLCKNAEDAFFGKAGQITIELNTRRLENEERTQMDVIASEFAVITVKDNGSGIPNDQLEKIFEPLFTTKEVGSGTGLGLSVVVGILRSWGGSIQVQSVLGKGTTFEIFIPIEKAVDTYDDLADLATGFEGVDIKAILNS